MIRTTRAILLVRVVAILSVLPLLWSIVALWFHPRQSVASIPTTDLSSPWVGTAVIPVAMALYLLYWLWAWPARRPGWAAVVLIGMGTVAALDQALALTPSAELWLYVAVVAGAALRRWQAALAVLLMAVLSQAARLQALPPPPGFGPPAGTWMDGLQIRLAPIATSVTQLVTGALGGMLVTYLVRTTAELYAARSGLARLAVEEERTRLARDLHDLLGHNLLLMAVKLELAGRLIGDRARPGAVEIREVQRMARDALRDVREVVSGYRQPTLARELAGAAVALEAAGIALELADHHGVLAPTLEAACAWLVREGTTNVIKHSGARTCRICLERRDCRLTVRIADDGAGGVHTTGMGLQGLGERVRALGGTLTAGGALGSGFHLVADLPLDLSATLEAREPTRTRQ